MSCTAKSVAATSDVAADNSEFKIDVLRGMAGQPKRLLPKYFYDARGSQLFDQICETAEYYPTRTELAIMREHAADMARALGPDVLLVELGSGSSVKIRLLLEQLQNPVAYVPVDISAEHLAHAASRVDAAYHDLQVLPLAADFTDTFTLPRPSRSARRTVAYFPGSTIGNFEPSQARKLLRRIAGVVGHDGQLLIGVDLRKDTGVLERAYNDAQGVTAAFNLNLLTRINRELCADFDLSAFAHRAFYNAELGRIEMHLLSLRDQIVCIGENSFALRKDETLHTESSYKYDVETFSALAAAAGFSLLRQWQDPEKLFAVMLFSAD